MYCYNWWYLQCTRLQILKPHCLLLPYKPSHAPASLPARLVHTRNLSVERLETELILLSAEPIDRNVLSTSQTWT
jgi:hypothetical protein